MLEKIHIRPRNGGPPSPNDGALTANTITHRHQCAQRIHSQNLEQTDLQSA
jgi:hypothetical protein